MCVTNDLCFRTRPFSLRKNFVCLLLIITYLYPPFVKKKLGQGSQSFFIKFEVVHIDLIKGETFRVFRNKRNILPTCRKKFHHQTFISGPFITHIGTFLRL